MNNTINSVEKDNIGDRIMPNEISQNRIRGNSNNKFINL
jgi:hypothetical protein